jgi:hypothetical protein
MMTIKEDHGYEIRIEGNLDPHWSAWFEGWTMTNLENGEVLLRNMKVDQSGIHGALNKIRDLNLTLISVSQIHKENVSVNTQ